LCVPDERPTRLAIVLFNLGAPDRPEAVRPFLHNLFRDPAILRVPSFVRAVLGRWIARSRQRPAEENYAKLGGRSPLLDLTRAQAAALEAALPEFFVRCFIAMRYWHPMSDAAARAVSAWRPDQLLLLPLYPQYSSTTSGSALMAWREAAARAGLAAPVHAVCCYPIEAGYIGAVTETAKRLYEATCQELPRSVPLRVLFSAHGLPEAIVRAGDPYEWQIRQTVTAILSAWGETVPDWTICYQSRATPQQWLSPSTEAEIARAARDQAAVMVVPVAFVSEHSETLVELDIDYSALAERLGVPRYVRVPAPATHPLFITGLAGLVRAELARPWGLHSMAGSRLCPSQHHLCPCAGSEAACPTS
jgi:protoporphyrin/coproporphyrin ferrochelatase